MNEAVATVIVFVVFGAIFLSPFVGAYVAIKHGARIRENARQRQVRTAIYNGMNDQNLINRTVEQMRDEGKL